MADTTIKQILSVVATTSERIKDLPIKSGQLVFIQDLNTIAFDFKDKRRFYNQIKEIDTEKARQELEFPVNGNYYFIIETAILWTYRNDMWIQITSKPNEIIFVGLEFPQLGVEQTIYANTTEGNEHIAIWSDELNDYKIVADKTQKISVEDIDLLFA